MASYISSQNGIFAKLKIFSIVGPAEINFYRMDILYAQNWIKSDIRLGNSDIK